MARTGAGGGVGLYGGPLAVEGIVLYLDAALGLGGVAPPRGAQDGVPGRGPLEGAEEGPLREHCACQGGC
jgi:hypothetical protein